MAQILGRLGELTSSPNATVVCLWRSRIAVRGRTLLSRWSLCA